MLQKARVLTVRIEPDLSAAIDEVQARYGTPISEQIRRGLRLWLEQQGVLKPDRKRAATRKRS